MSAAVDHLPRSPRSGAPIRPLAGAPPADAAAEAAPAPRAGHSGHLRLVVVGHVDHGKSTLIGRLLFDTHSVAEGRAESIQAACQAEGMEFEPSFLLDALLEEQAQNVTLDTTRVPLRTPQRDYTIIDAPGHEEFLKHMVTGAASADAAVLLIDAHEGLREQTRRHGFLLSLLGLRQVAVVINKMDLVQYDAEVYRRLRQEAEAFLRQLGVEPAEVIPLSARHGEGLLRASPRMPWYRGPALLEALAAFAPAPAPETAPLRFVVQDVYRFDSRRILAGLVEAGRLRAGDPVEFHPGGKRSRIRAIERWPDAAAGGAPAVARAGAAVAVTLADEIVVERGQIGAEPGRGPVAAREFLARIFWLHPEALREGDLLPLRLGTQQAEARVVAVQRKLDAVTLEITRGETAVRRHEVAELRLRTRRPVAFDLGREVPALSRFVLMRGRRLAGGGVIDAVVPQPPEPIVATPSARAAMLGHRGAILWMTGLSGAGKSTLAAALEVRLLRANVLPAVVDGDVLRAGLSRGLGFSPEDRRENLRRATELALHLAEAGVVVVGALISPFRSDRAAVAERARERGIPFIELFIHAPLSECERRDPKQLYRRARAGQIPDFTGIGSPYEPPLAPDLEIRTDRQSIEQSVEQLLQLALAVVRPSPGEPEGRP